MRWVRLDQQATSITSTTRLVTATFGRPVDDHPQGDEAVAAGQVADVGNGADAAHERHAVDVAGVDAWS